MSGLGRVLPAADWLPAYRWEWFRFDLVAGLTAAAVVIPQAMAYAAIAGLPLVVGLYASLIPLVVYAVMGTSRVMSFTTTSTIGIMSATILGQVVPGGEPAAMLTASATLCLVVGAFLLAAGLLRLGVVANLVSDPVLIGFKAGVGLVIVMDQLPKLLGIQITKAGFFRDIVSIVGQLPQTSIATLILAVAMLALMLGLKRVAPRVPAALVAVALGIAASAWVGLDKAGISLVGTVQAGLPSFALPDFSLVGQLWPAAMGIALMSFVETAAVGRAFLLKGDPTPDSNSELAAAGMANIAASLFHGMPAGGGTSQTAVNMGSGARSQMAGLVTAAVVIATLLFLAPLFALMPHATLASVLVIASIGLIKPKEFAKIRRVRIMEFRWALVALAGVLVLGTLKGVMVSVVMSLVGLMIRGSGYPVRVLGRKPGTHVFRALTPEHPEDETFPGLLLLRPEGAIYFANARRLGDEMRKQWGKLKPRVVALDLSAVPNLEYTALRMLSEGEEKLREEGITLWLVAMNSDVLDVVQRFGLAERLGRERTCFTLQQAVERYQALGAQTAGATPGSSR